MDPAPPSLTLSAQSSVHFATSVALRDNKPRDGISSLGLLCTGESVAKQPRTLRPSWDISVKGHSTLEGAEPVHEDWDASGRLNSGKGRAADAEEEESRNTPINLQ